jgi:hypothetical protein
MDKDTNSTENLQVTITNVEPNNSSTISNSENQENPQSTSTKTTTPTIAGINIVDVDENLKTDSLTGLTSGGSGGAAASLFGGGSGGGYSSWWGSLVKTAKEKSKTALELIKNDFEEFKTTMATDTNSLITQITNIDLANNPLITNINRTLSNLTQEDQEDSSSKLASGASSSSIYDRYLNELKSLQSNQTTYLVDPQDETQFREFKTNFDSDSYKTVISDLLIENSSMRLLYSQIVPAQISNNDFWSRYFFKVNQLEEEHRKRVKLLERVSSNGSSIITSNNSNNVANSNETNEARNDWGDDEDDLDVQNQEIDRSQPEKNDENLNATTNEQLDTDEKEKEDSLTSSQPSAVLIKSQESMLKHEN